MTKSQLVAALSARFPQLALSDTALSVNFIIEAVANAMACRNRVEIRGFGSFSLTYRSPRVGRNPRTGEKVDVSGKWAPHFKAGKDMRERVDGSQLAEQMDIYYKA